MKTTDFADYLRKKRIEKGVGLREFARTIEIQPSNYSNIESGSLPPPKEEIMQRIIKALGIKKGTSDYRKICDLAAKGRDEVPADLASLIKKNTLIPAMLRTVEDEKVTPGQLKNIIEDIKSGRYAKTGD
jgi:transcriptional regulator with XRE-family HTH domain